MSRLSQVFDRKVGYSLSFIRSSGEDDDDDDEILKIIMITLD